MRLTPYLTCVHGCFCKGKGKRSKNGRCGWMLII